MNERIRELRKQAWKEAYNVDPDDPRIARAHKAMEEGIAKFAELIVAECNKISKETCNELVADESIQTPGSKINWHLYNATLHNKLADHFWVEL